MGTEDDPEVSALARKGGLARARALTPEARREIAKKAANARWDIEFRDAGGRTVGIECKRGGPEAAFLSRVEEDVYEEIWKKALSHSIHENCSCDECLETVLTNLRNKYLNVLAKIDNRERLDLEEGALFKLLTGSKADRWTRVYRQACKEAAQKRNGSAKFI
jgi:hypothetical protein